jgi:uncharacterized protein YndB with AHSA1/START domain
MQPLQYSISIHATPQKIWEILWHKTSYTIWTSPFTYGTYALGQIALGESFQFLNPDGGGLYGTIDICKNHQEIRFNHNGEVKNFEKIIDDSAKEIWGKIHEHYVLETNGNETILTVTIAGMNDWQAYFDDTFPKALQTVKNIIDKKLICIEINTSEPIHKVWTYYTSPNHIMHWNQASPDWHCPKAENDLQISGAFSYTMAAKDASFSFDFSGKYTAIENEKIINYTMDDGRICEILFIQMKEGTRIVQAFEPETENTIELQTGGWQAILDSFVNYLENNKTV